MPCSFVRSARKAVPAAVAHTPAAADADNTGAAANNAHTQLFLDVLAVMLHHQLLPLDIACVSKAARTLAAGSQPVKLNIRAGMTAATMQSLLRRRRVKHVHIDGHNVRKDVTAALAAALPAYNANLVKRRVVTTLWPRSLTECTVENFEQWDYQTVLTLIETLPNSVTTLTVAAQQPQNVGFLRPTIRCPPGVQTLRLRNIRWNVCHNTTGLRPDVHQLTTVYYEGHVNMHLTCRGV
jgi:hypothetical protein